MKDGHSPKKAPPEEHWNSGPFQPYDGRLDLPPGYLQQQIGTNEGSRSSITLTSVELLQVEAPKHAAAQSSLKGAPDRTMGESQGSISHHIALGTDLQEQSEKSVCTRELVKKFVADIWNRGDLELIPEVCHHGLRFNGSVGLDRVGHEGFARMVSTIREALTDYHCEIHSMVVEGNKAFARMRFTGRHDGPLLGYPPTGQLVAWMGAAEFTCKDGRILKVWELGDVKALEEQLSGTDGA